MESLQGPKLIPPSHHREDGTPARGKRGGRRPGAGRPTRYCPELAQKLTEYFEEQVTLASKTPGHLDWHEMPTLECFSDWVGIHLQTMRNWTLIHSEFMIAYAVAKMRRQSAIDRVKRFHDPSHIDYLG